MAIKLKQHRVKAGLTQAELAKTVGVSQPNYQRWEAGSAPIPEDKLRKLAKALKTKADVLLGRHPPIEAVLYDASAGEDVNYYGEVAVHFLGGGRPLLLSISDGAFSRLHRTLQLSPAFVTVESLSNQTVIIRTQAIADLYFSSEAYGTFGPEHDDYDELDDLQMPDARDWEIVEALCNDDEIGLAEFAPEDVERVSNRVMISDDQYAKLVADGVIQAEDLKDEKEKNWAITERIFALATEVSYQLTSGQRRSIAGLEPAHLFEAFGELVECEDAVLGNPLIRLPVEGSHRIAFIHREALDYVMLPTHQFEQGRIEAVADLLDESE